MVQTQVNATLQFQKWQHLKMSKTQVMEELQSQQLSSEDMAAIWDNYYRYRVDKRNSLGWFMMFGGGAMGLVSCVLTMIDPLPELRWVFMYLFTTIAVSVSLYGCYLVMEKPGDEEG
jgi:hypothetical protein